MIPFLHAGLCAALLLSAVALVRGEDKKTDPTGSWSWTMPGRNGRPDRKMTLKLKLDGDKVMGKLIAPIRGDRSVETEIKEGRIKHGKISFTVTREMGGNAMVTKYTGKITDDTFKGSMSFELNGKAGPEVAWEARRDVDQSTLGNIATANAHAGVRLGALGRVTDPAVLAKVAIDAKYPEVQMGAVERVSDQAVLEKVLEVGAAPEVRVAATRRFRNQRILAKLATEDKDSGVRQAAASRIHQLAEQARCVELLIEDPDATVRRNALEKLSPETLADQAVAARLAINGKDAQARYAAVEKVSDEAVLRTVLALDAEQGVRDGAAVTLAVLATANLPVSERVRRNWPLLRRGMSADTVGRLIGPLPESASDAAVISGGLGSLERDPLSMHYRLVSDLYELEFDNFGLTGWRLMK
jgi:hypothetical protein